MDSPAPAPFRGLLRKHRLAIGLSQEELAERAHLSARAISDLERGERLHPRPETVRLLAEALDLNPEQAADLHAAAQLFGPATSQARIFQSDVLARSEDAPVDPGEPRLRLMPRPELLHPASVPALPGEIRPLRSHARRSHNLPIQLTSLIGREADIAAASELLGGGSCRLLTLIGSGGVGKTRLALQVGADLVPRYPDGVWLVELAPVADPTFVGPTVAAVLGIQNPANRPILDRLVEALGSRRLLLLLDNCEHVLDASARLADALLRGCPNLQIQATSREALGIGGEVSRRVPSLALPPAETLPPVPDLARIEAVQLFIDRARAVRPGFTLTNQNASAVTEICRRLDGIPLAVELAAARLEGMSARQLAARLDQRFRLLTRGSRAALARQQTLAAAVAWSYDLLTPAEQTLFTRLAVFLDGFTLEAAEAVGADTSIADTPSRISRDDVLDLLLRLVEKSLVVAEPGEDEADRYRLLETLRQYAREKLLASGELEAVSRGHAGFYLALAEQGEPELHGPEQAVWLDRLEREHNNLRTAIDWLTTNDEWLDALRLAGASSWFWLVRGYYTEGRARLGAILARAGPGAPAAHRARACEGLAHLAIRQGDISRARLHAEDSHNAAKESGDQLWLARASLALAWTSWATGGSADEVEAALAHARAARQPWIVGRALWQLMVQRRGQRDPVGAAAALAEGQAISRQAGDDWTGIWWSRTRCEVAENQGDYPQARLAAEEAGRIAGRLRDRSNQALALRDRGLVAFAEGDLATALPCFAEARAIYRDVADRNGLALAAAGLCELHLLRGEIEAARNLAAEALELARETAYLSVVVEALRVSAEVELARDEAGVARSLLREAVELSSRGRLPEFLPLLETVARVAVADNDPGRLLRLVSAATTERARLGQKRRPIDEARLAPAIQQAEQMLSDAELAAACAEGQAMSLEQVVAYALEETGR